MEEKLADKVKRLERELIETKRQIEGCKHEFTNPIQTTRKTSEEIFEGYKPQGSDPIPIYRTVPTTEYGYERTCKTCGYSEYTSKTKPIIQKYEPDFGGNKR